MKKMRKFIMTATSAVMAMTAVGCKDGKTESLKVDDVLVWGAPTTEKILQDKGVDFYEDVKTSPAVSLTMAKGEYEGAQVIITPEKDVSYYNVTVSDLRHTDGETVIPKSKIGVYKQMYVPLTVKFQRNDAVFGMYPDAIVPFEAIVEYEENKIDKEENQGIYFNVETELEQKVGTYTGSITIDFGSFKQIVPFSVNVVNAQVSEENHAKSCILTQWTYWHGELNSTQEMRDAYTDALVKYRLAPSTLLQENDHSPELIQQYVEKAYEYMQNPRFSNCTIPNKTTSVTYEGDGQKYECMDGQNLENYLLAFAKKSFETGYNMMEKLVYYNTIIDEPSDRGLGNTVNVNCKVFNTTIKKVADALEADDTITSEIKAEVIESIRKIPNIVTNQYVETWADRTGDEYVNTFCPLSNHFDAAEQRAQYDVQDERWWYVCNNPYYPYPNWQLESSDLLAPRVMGWMQAEYDIVGVLYWSANLYTVYDPAQGTAVDMEDWYGENARRTKHGSSLEGVLFHPGGQYGLSEPVGSLRLEAIRDGLEEYELLLSLKEKYAELGFSADSLTASMNSTLFSGAQVSATSSNMAAARQSLLELCSAVQSPAQMCIVDSKDNGSGSVETKVFLKSGYSLKNDNQPVTAVTPTQGGNIYTVVSRLDEAENYLNLSFDAEGTTYTYTQFLGGKVSGQGASDLAGAFKNNNATVTAEVVDKAVIGGEGSTLKLTIGETSGVTQRIQFYAGILSEIDEDIKKGVFTIYNPSDEDIELTVHVTFEKSPLLNEYAKLTLKAHEYTAVELNFNNVTWGKVGSVKEIYILLGSSKEELEKVLYIDGFALYNK